MDLEQAVKDTCEYLCSMPDDVPEELRPKIAILRQWLNEDRITDPKRMVTNEDIWNWLK